jgi:hypothetical protein
VVQTVTERNRAIGGAASPGTRERLGVVVVSVHEQQLEVGPAKHGTGRAEEPASFRVAGQVAEIAQGDERVAALLDSALDQTAQVVSITVQVAKGEQAAHSSRAYRTISGSPLAAGRRPG